MMSIITFSLLLNTLIFHQIIYKIYACRIQTNLLLSPNRIRTIDWITSKELVCMHASINKYLFPLSGGSLLTKNYEFRSLMKYTFSRLLRRMFVEYLFLWTCSDRSWGLYEGSIEENDAWNRLREGFGLMLFSCTRCEVDATYCVFMTANASNAIFYIHDFTLYLSCYFQFSGNHESMQFVEVLFVLTSNTLLVQLFFRSPFTLKEAWLKLHSFPSTTKIVHSMEHSFPLNTKIISRQEYTIV